eukprot:CAMPEP_0194483678 /NCGR_PEP_ID=MMETSP0253-20130528/5210_1 /TAXON_ID=2966 /ORGANISM="Noctiluca scintillans" /LENGTH=78 /DNA_ID=CAMNT_0039323357 /DNA_START=27 /DNA_END=263 /DNA_ORIENTATION=-
MTEGTGGLNFLCACICAYLLPPLGIYWRFGCGIQLLICVILTCFGYLPGVLYAVVLIGCEETSTESKDLEMRGGPTRA